MSCHKKDLNTPDGALDRGGRATRNIPWEAVVKEDGETSW